MLKVLWGVTHSFTSHLQIFTKYLQYRRDHTGYSKRQIINGNKRPTESAAFPQHLNRSMTSLTSALFCSFCFLWERSSDPWRQCETELYRKRTLSKSHLISYRNSFAVWTWTNSSCSAFRNHKINIRKAAEGVRGQMFVALCMVLSNS